MSAGASRTGPPNAINARTNIVHLKINALLIFHNAFTSLSSEKTTQVICQSLHAHIFWPPHSLFAVKKFSAQRNTFMLCINTSCKRTDLESSIASPLNSKEQLDQVVCKESPLNFTLQSEAAVSEVA